MLAAVFTQWCAYWSTVYSRYLLVLMVSFCQWSHLPVLSMCLWWIIWINSIFMTVIYLHNLLLCQGTFLVIFERVSCPLRMNSHPLIDQMIKKGFMTWIQSEHNTFKMTIVTNITPSYLQWKNDWMTINGWMDKWMNDEKMHEWMNGWMTGLMNEWLNALTILSLIILLQWHHLLLFERLTT